VELDIDNDIEELQREEKLEDIEMNDET